jgi:hypothetical protein
MTAQPIKGPASYFPSIEQKYGHPIDYWKAIVRANYPAKHGELVQLLKAHHGMGNVMPMPSWRIRWRKTKHKLAHSALSGWRGSVR